MRAWQQINYYLPLREEGDGSRPKWHASKSLSLFWAAQRSRSRLYFSGTGSLLQFNCCFYTYSDAWSGSAVPFLVIHPGRPRRRASEPFSTLRLLLTASSSSGEVALRVNSEVMPSMTGPPPLHPNSRRGSPSSRGLKTQGASAKKPSAMNVEDEEGRPRHARARRGREPSGSSLQSKELSRYERIATR